MKLYVYRNLCENFRQIGQKKEEVIAYTSRVLRSEREQPDMTSHAAYKEGRRWSNSQMYSFFLWKLSNAFPTQVVERNRLCLVPDLSNTRDFMSRACAICAPLSWSELGAALLGDISELDCTGQKVNRLRNCWAYINVFGLIWKRKIPAIP